ncbi:MAG TPA: TIGR04255 family protein [Pirellulales bacterium]|nr:TIGR04255 family protein [Pirellulales bacterium]
MADVERLPKFKDPPVVETALSVQFDPVPKFNNTHLGLFLHYLGKEWANASDAPPLPAQFERFEPVVSWENMGVQFQLTQEIALRMQARNASNDRMIQLQNGRLSFNWLGDSGIGYPSYDFVRPEFEAAAARLSHFLSEHQLGDLRPNQWEVTYLNHLPMGTVWKDTHEWAAPFRHLIASPGSPAGTKAESFGGEWHYEIVPQRGRLHVQLKSAWRKNDGPEAILLLVLTARGPAHSDGTDLLAGLDLGHETIVRAFADLTTEYAQRIWNRTQ